MTALPILVVTTNHSRYVIDQNAGKYARQTVHDDANPIPGHSEGEWHEYLEILSGLEEGQRLVITHADGSWLQSTLVKAVEEQ